MKILHTADWHLGHILHGVSREFEHGRFLAWLLDTLESEAVDALVVAGDVFDGSNPIPSVQRAYYEFVSESRRRCPGLDVIVVGGNHDSPARLNAPESLLSALGVRVVGDLPRREDRSLDLDRALVPVSGPDGKTAAWVVAMPFLRPSDLPLAEDREEGLSGGVRALYARLVEEALRRRRPGEAVVATGHCYMVGGALSELSERRIQRGNQEALPDDIFPPEIAYVALGHLHRAQRVAGRENVRYSGSPIPLSVTEKDYRHEVRIVELDGAEFVSSRPIHVPRAVDMITVPPEHRPLEEVLELLAALDRAESPEVVDPSTPYLEVRVLLDKVQPRVRHEVERALDGARARLLRIDSKYTGTGESLGDTVERENLRELDPEDVFVRCYRRSHEGDVPAEVMDAFRELMETAEHEGAQ